ncbi:MAG: FAD-binding oxidoreductase [Deltaproteobacteria bacterium]|nr:FAD-binding oxidoreductase [Deltaproteobacteria bacterium]
MKEIVIIGGGFFGLYLAEFFALKKHRILLLEQEDSLMRRASYHNQARVHNGYHYPRSILTALRSHTSFSRFISEFKGSVYADFDKYYGVGRPLGKITAKQFLKFCEKVGIPWEPAPSKIKELTNPRLVEEIFTVKEVAFDANKLTKYMTERLEALPVEIKTGVMALEVKPLCKGLALKFQNCVTGEISETKADHVFNCTYSHMNKILCGSGIEIIPLKHEITEMCLVDVPDVLRNTGITIMCGPFFSVMPFPPVPSTHSFSHVRYTPHFDWHEKTTGHTYAEPDIFLKEYKQASAWQHIKRDAARYMPVLAGCFYRDSLWEVKSILPRSETDDSRPILFKPNHGLQGLHCVLGGKIDNVYDVVEAISESGLV